MQIDVLNQVDINSINQNNKLEQIKAQKLASSDETLKSVCNDFEAFFMNHLLEISMKNSSIAGEGTGSEIFKGMYTDTLSQKSAGSLGISELLYNFLSENKK